MLTSTLEGVLKSLVDSSPIDSEQLDGTNATETAAPGTTEGAAALQKTLERNVVKANEFLPPGEQCRSPSVKAFVQAACWTILALAQTPTDSANTQLEHESSTDTTAQPPPMLSIQDRKDIHTLLELIVAVGVVPHLQPGVGRPLAHRIGPGARAVTQDNNLDSKQHRPKYLHERDVFICVKSLNESVLGISGRMTDFIPVVLSDVVAALLQMGYGPIPKVGKKDCNAPQPAAEYGAQDTPATVSKKALNSPVDSNILTSQEREECVQIAHSLLLQRLHPRGSFEALFALGGGPKQPSWLKLASSHLIAQNLLRRQGVISFLSLILPRAQKTADPAEQCLGAARMVSTYPKHSTFTAEEFVEKISRQVIQIYNLPQSEDNNRVLRTA